MRHFVLTDLGPAPAPLYRVTTLRARVREGPATSYPVACHGLAILLRDEQIEVDGQIVGEAIDGRDTWLHLADGRGFVHCSLLEAL